MKVVLILQLFPNQYVPISFAVASIFPHIGSRSKPLIGYPGALPCLDLLSFYRVFHHFSRYPTLLYTVSYPRSQCPWGGKERCGGGGLFCFVVRLKTVRAWELCRLAACCPRLCDGMPSCHGCCMLRSCCSCRNFS